MTGTITQLRRDRGNGSLLAEDGKAYSFRRSDVRDVWFHDLTEGAAVTFEVQKKAGELHAILVRLVRPSR
jgi:cold shock CspA family protein